jgi:WD40 repeat protein
MPDQQSARIFISYSRKDGAPFADQLRKQLITENLSVWQDIVALEGGRDWWSQIEDALRSKALQHFLLVVTPAALASSTVRREVRLARQEGKAICPIKGSGLGDLAKLPRWLGQVFDIELPEHFTTLIRVLQDQSRQKRVAMMAPDPPDDFVQRASEFDALKKRLLDSKGDSVAITAALRGAGGYGKTTLAKALAHDLDIQDAYFDGILWAELGEKPVNLLSIISDLIEILSGARPGLESINAAAAKLGEALGDRRILMIVDDAWRDQDLRPFLQGGPNTTRLITTRLDNILPSGSVRQPVDAMQDREALELLGAGLPAEQVATQHVQLGKLAGRLGEWALLLKLVNGFLRDRATKRQLLSQAIAGVNKRLDERGLVAFDARNEADRTKAVARTIGVSLEALDDARRDRFAELAIFPEDVDIPIGIIELLWAETSGLDSFEIEDFLGELYALSLLLDLDFDRRTVRLHDTVRFFLHNQAGKHGLIAQHRLFLQALDAIGRQSGADTLTRRYYYLWMPYHLAEAGERERLDGLLLNPAWLIGKLEATDNPQTLVADYEQHAVGNAQNLIGRTLRLTAGICARDKRQLIPQLLGRLMRCQGTGMSIFLDAARRQLVPPALLTEQLSLTAPGAETARLEGHSSSVLAMCLLGDGRLAAASGDGTIRLWDVKTGTETARLQGPSGRIFALCLLPGERLASGSGDGTIRLWDLKTRAETGSMRKHSRQVYALCLLQDGRLAAASGDGVIRLWDVTTRAETACLEGHLGRVYALCLLLDGRLASGSEDMTIRLWDVEGGAETARLEGHGGAVESLCLLADGRLASVSGDRTIRLWDLRIGIETDRLEGRRGSIGSLCLLADGRLAAASEYNTIQLWDVKTGAQTASLEGQWGWVSALCLLPGERLASGSGDGTIRLWDVTPGAQNERLEGHSSWIDALCLLPDGRLASGSGDKTIRLWDVKTGAETARLEGHSGRVYSLCLLPDGRLASGSRDSTIRLWDVKAGGETARLEGHSGSVRALCLLSDGRLASASADGTIRLWDLKTGAETGSLRKHSRQVYALCLLRDGRLAAAAGDGTIRLWDVKTSTETARLPGHSGWVYALRLLPDGRLASSSGDRTIRVWDTTTGAETTCLEGHSGRVYDLCLLPDGRLASGSRDTTIRIWNLRAEREITRLETDAPIGCLACLADGRLVAGGGLGRLHWLQIVD